MNLHAVWLESMVGVINDEDGFFVNFIQKNMFSLKTEIVQILKIEKKLKKFQVAQSESE